MNVADANPYTNPSSDLPLSPEALCQQIDQTAETLMRTIRSAAKSAESFDSVERCIHKTVFDIGRQAVSLFISLQGAGDLGQTITTESGETLLRNPQKTRTLIRSIFGTHRFKPFNDAPGPKKAIALRPVSARMSLPQHRWSYLLQGWAQMLAVDSAYQQAMDNLGVILGGEKFSVDTAESINHQMGTEAGEYLDNLPKPSPESEGK